MANLIEIGSLESLREHLARSRVAVVKFYLNDCSQCQRAAPVFRELSETFSVPNRVTFMRINKEAHPDICQRYGVTTTPTFIIFREGEVIEKSAGTDISVLRDLLTALTSDLSPEVDEGWNGADIPRGFGNITEEVEARGCELLNAGDDGGPVSVLFDKSEPSALGKGKGDGSSKDWVQSGSDDQLLLFIPLMSTVKLHTLQITSLPPKDQTDISRPCELRLFINRMQNMDFDEAETADSIQTITVAPSDWNENGTASVGLRFVKFTKTSSLTIFVQRGEEGAESVRIDRVRLIGEAGVMRKMRKLQKVGEDE